MTGLRGFGLAFASAFVVAGCGSSANSAAPSLDASGYDAGGHDAAPKRRADAAPDAAGVGHQDGAHSQDARAPSRDGSTRDATLQGAHEADAQTGDALGSDAPSRSDAHAHPADAGDGSGEDARSPSDAASDAGVTPGGLFGDGTLVHGVKLQCVADPQNTMVCKMPLEYETHGLTYAEAVAQLARQGVPDVVIKICELNNQCKKTSSFDRTDRNQAIVKLLTAFADATDPTNAAYIVGYAPRLFLWERQWMWSNGALNTNDVAFADDVSSVVVDAFDKNVGRVLDGVGVIEDQLPSSEDVLHISLKVADRINAQTSTVTPDGWLKKHTLMFPGGGNGTWFNGIGAASSAGTFFHDMSQRVGHFAFIYKNFPLEKNCVGDSEDSPLCSRGIVASDVEASAPGGRRYSHDFVDCLEKSKHLTPDAGYLGDFACHDDEGKKAYLLASNGQGGLGLGDLRDFIADDCGAHPTVTNVLMWGDSGDAFAEMSAGNVRAVHAALVDDPWPAGHTSCSGYVVPQTMKANQLSHKAILPTHATGKDKWTHVFVRQDAALARNDRDADPADESQYTNTLTVWQEWDAWPRVTPASCSAASLCY